MGMSRAAYTATGLGFRRGNRQILIDIDLEVVSGRVLALVGPNGAGKSSLLGVLAGDLAASAGRVEMLGRSVDAWRPADLARHRAVLLQANEVSFPFTVAEVVEMGRNPWLGHSDRVQDERAVQSGIARTDIAHLLERPFTALSGGEKARVSLARVLAQDTGIVLLDEPTAALDLRHQEEVMTVARELADEGRAVVVVLHDLSIAGAYADRVAVIESGRLVAHGTPDDVITARQIAQTYGIDVHGTTTPDGHIAVVPRRTTTHRPHRDTSSEQPDEVSYTDPDTTTST